MGNVEALKHRDGPVLTEEGESRGTPSVGF